MKRDGFPSADEQTMRILSHFRRNARQPLTKVSRKTSIPVSTIFDRLKECEGSLIKKYTSLIDFNKLSFVTRANLVLKFSNDDRKEAAEHLLRHPHVNSLYKVSNGYDYMAEVIFKTLNELENFREYLEERFNLEKYDMHFIVDDLKREAFMADADLADMHAQ